MNSSGKNCTVTTPRTSEPQGSAVLGGFGVKAGSNVAAPLRSSSSDRDGAGVASQALGTLNITSAEKTKSTAALAEKTSGGSSILLFKLMGSSSRRDHGEIERLKQVLKAQNVIITNLLSKIDHLKLVSTLTKSSQVKEAIAATKETAEGLNGNQKALIGSFNEAERATRHASKTTPEQHPTSLANQKTTLNLCQDLKASIPKQQEDINALKTPSAKTQPTYA